jgi:phosphate transport system permease protein
MNVPAAPNAGSRPGLALATAQYRRRRAANAVGLSLSMAAMALGLIVLLWILFVLLSKGLGALELRLFVQDTPGPGSSDGGLRNAIAGSLMMLGLTVLVSTPAGVLAGIYLAEYGEHGATAKVTRFIIDIMLSAPSIVLGLFAYLVAGHFSGYAGVLALTLIAVPVIARTTENMLRLVPGSLREAAAALGAPRWKVSLLIGLRAARNGVITGLLLAVARVSGETAPLLFTALNNQFFSTDMSQPLANLPVTIFNFAMSLDDNWIALAWGGALLITLAVLALNVMARVFFRDRGAR